MNEELLLLLCSLAGTGFGFTISILIMRKVLPQQVHLFVTMGKVIAMIGSVTLFGVSLVFFTRGLWQEALMFVFVATIGLLCFRFADKLLIDPSEPPEGEA